VAIGLASGEGLEELEINHRPEGFQEFFSRIEKHDKTESGSVTVAMEGYNGYPGHWKAWCEGGATGFIISTT
jgi:hypothetical protein